MAGAAVGSSRHEVEGGADMRALRGSESEREGGAGWASAEEQAEQAACWAGLGGKREVRFSFFLN